MLGERFRLVVRTWVILLLLAPAAAWSQAARGVEPVVLTGAQVPDWSRSAATVVCAPYPSGTTGGRDAHNGTLIVPPDLRTGVPVDEIAAFRWSDSAGGAWVEIPVQVDQRFPYCLSNPPSGFSFYSGTDQELTYAWDVESWKKVAGQCSAAYPDGVGATADPIATLDDDDEIALMASDAGDQAPLAAAPPPGATRTLAVALVDPLDPQTRRFVYLVLRPGGSSFTTANGYVHYARDANADEWIDRYSIARNSPDVLGVSNTSYGPNLSGTVCRTATCAADCSDYPAVPDGTPRPSTDRFVRDGVTVTTGTYRWRATGRWMVRDIRIRRAGQPPATYGPDLIDRWKGRAFQQSPDSTISLVGFEDEQVNWEANSAILGERSGPVRAIREVWGADSGTNVTKTEAFYRDEVTYHYHVRVHPIPPDGLYTSWDYNHGVAARYYNTIKPNGVAIDGMNDDVGNVDGVFGMPAFFDAPDPTFNAPSAILNWEEISGAADAGSLVYIVEIKGATTAENPAVVPYYRDDACLDDGTGDDPVPRPWPGEASSDPRVHAGYEAENGGTPYAQLRCDQRQGAWGAHGVHYFFSSDTDNAASPEVLTEIDVQQWQFMVPTATPTNVGQPYGNVVIAPLQKAALTLPGLLGSVAPTAADASVTAEHDTAVTATLSGTAIAACDLTFAIVTPPAHGALGAIASAPCAIGLPSSDTAQVTYTPHSGYTGDDTFTYRVSDGVQSSAPATVHVTVKAGIPALCAPRPATGCRLPVQSGKSKLQITNQSVDTRDRVKWRWTHGQATTSADLGDPIAGETSYQLCVYDAGGNTIAGVGVPPRGTCDKHACWRHAGTALSYRRRGVRLVVRPGGDGAARISVNASGVQLNVAALPPTQPVTAQLKNSAGSCWEATFSPPARMSSAVKFQDASD